MSILTISSLPARWSDKDQGDKSISYSQGEIFLPRGNSNFLGTIVSIAGYSKRGVQVCISSFLPGPIASVALLCVGNDFHRWKHWIYAMLILAPIGHMLT